MTGLDFNKLTQLLKIFYSKLIIVLILNYVYIKYIFNV
jgi:hypothetical protein